jgi:hypothetical protein
MLDRYEPKIASAEPRVTFNFLQFQSLMRVQTALIKDLGGELAYLGVALYLTCRQDFVCFQ